MKKPTAGIGYNKSRAKLVAEQKKLDAVEAGLAARRARVVKTIAISSAALGLVAIGIFTASKFKKKKKGLFS